MYERSAIVLERYFNFLFGLQKEYNLKTNYQNFITLVEELQKYQAIVEEEEQVIKAFDEVATKIQEIQKKQEKLSAINVKLEEERGKLFNNLDEAPSLIEKKFIKVESSIDNNNEQLKQLKEQYIVALKGFSDRQIERNQCSRTRRVVETNHISFVKQVTEELQDIDIGDIKKVKTFFTATDDSNNKNELIKSMLENGKNEKIKFNEEVIEKSVEIRLEIAKKEAEAYLLAYDKMRRLLSEIENDNLKLSKYKKVCRDLSVKFAFLDAEKEYIVGFLDNERMTAINGPKVHNKMMEEACEKFDLDIIQIRNLYELILREVAGKSTKKAYNELYNKTYLKDIEDKEKNFEEEINNVKIQGTIINSNYWRIEGIKNLYEVFQKEVSEKFDKDLSEYKIEELEEEKTEDMNIFNASGDVLDGELLDESTDFDEDNEDDELEELEEIFDENGELKTEKNSQEDEEDLEDEYEDEFENEDLEDEYDEDDYEDEEFDEEDEEKDLDDNYEDEDMDIQDEYEEDEDDYDEEEYEDEAENEDLEDEDEEEYNLSEEDDETYYDEDSEYSDDYYDEDDEHEEFEEKEDDELDSIYKFGVDKNKKRKEVKKRNPEKKKVTENTKRGNIDDRLAMYKEKMKEEKQNRGFFSFFKDKKN